MNRHELALMYTSHWIKVLGGSLKDKSIAVGFAGDGYFPDGRLAAWRLRWVTRETLPKAVAHLLRDGQTIPEEENSEAIAKNTFDSIEITVLQVPEKDSIPKWVEEEYFARGILQALLQVRYPNWDKHQLVNYEKKLIGKKGLGRAPILRTVFHVCVLALAVFSINLAIFWVLNGYTMAGSMENLSFAIMIEGLFIAAYGIAAFTRTLDITIYDPTGGTFYEHVRFPPRLSAAITFLASGLLLYFVGLYLLI